MRVLRRLLLVTSILPLPLAGQSAVGPPPGRWDVTVFGGLSQHLSGDRLHSALGLGLGLRRHLGSRSGVALEATYLPLGSVSTATPYASIFQPELRGTLTTFQSRKILRLGLGFDLPVTSGPVRPTFLVGVSAARFRGEYRSGIVDTAGTQLASTNNSGWSSAWGAHVGLGLTLPMVARLQPMLEGRLHGFLLNGGAEGWSGLPVLTVGLALTY